MFYCFLSPVPPGRSTGLQVYNELLEAIEVTEAALSELATADPDAVSSAVAADAVGASERDSFGPQPMLSEATQEVQRLYQPPAKIKHTCS